VSLRTLAGDTAQAVPPQEDVGAAALRLLVLSRLYPNAAMPTFGVFVENRLRRILATGAAAAHVVAAVPWFPSTHARFGEYGRWARVPARETRFGVEVTHPRYLAVPKVDMRLQPTLVHRALRRHVAALRRRGLGFDVVDAHYFYPDGVAAARLARELDLPLVITARGTDLNLVPSYPAPRRMIVEAAARADAIVTVCAALKTVLSDLGVPDDKVHVLRNGVDLELFTPGDRNAARRRLDVAGPLLLSVGSLIERKGHHLAIEALARLPEARLAIAGDGPEEGALRALANRLGVADRVRFLGNVPHEALADVYRAADALVLASSREGWANVLLEAMACGTPVVATEIWGTPEVVAAPEAGRLVARRDASALAEAVRALLADPPERAATRRYAERFSWEDTVQGQLAVFRAVARARRGGEK
jgi:glycosyltransferase involved in cell wall biosynthesis